MAMHLKCDEQYGHSEHSWGAGPPYYFCPGQVFQTPATNAYVQEYGHAPTNREDQDRYSAFRFGFEAGVRYGSHQERNRIRNLLGEEHA